MGKNNLAEKIIDEAERSSGTPQYIRDIRQTPWRLLWRDIKFDHDNISYEETLEEDSQGVCLFRINEPLFAPCPPLPEILMGWISTPNWDNRRVAEVQVREEISRSVEGKGHVPEKFTDNPARSEALAIWQKERQGWRYNELVKERTRKLYADLYEVLLKINRFPNQYDLWFGDVFFADAKNEAINFPLLWKKISLRLNDGAMEAFIDHEPTFFYGELLEGLSEVHALAVQKMVKKHGAHFSPLSANLNKLLPRLAAVISPHCRLSTGSNMFRDGDHYVIYEQPTLWLAPRPQNTAQWLSGLRLKFEKTPPLSAISALTKEAEPEVVIFADENKAIKAAIAGEISGLLVSTPPGTDDAGYAAKILLDSVVAGKKVVVTSKESQFLARVWEKISEKVRSVTAAPDFCPLEQTWRQMQNLLAVSPKEIVGVIDDLSSRKKQITAERQAAQEELDRLLSAETDSVTEFNGASWSRCAMAKFMAEHSEVAGLIPGTIYNADKLPLTEEEFAFLYRLGKEFDPRTKADMEQKLPSLSELPSAYSYEGFLREWQNLENRQAELLKKLPGWKVNDSGYLVSPQNDVLTELDDDAFKEAARAYRELSFSWLEQPWAKEAILAGKQGGGKRQVWDQLGQDIAKVQEMKDAAVTLLLGKIIECPANIFTDEDVLPELSAMEKSLPENGRGKLPFWTQLVNRRRQWLCKQITINGKQIGNREDCRTAIRYIELQKARAKVKMEWDQLMSSCGGSTYAELKASGDDVDDLCSARWRQIAYCLDWYEKKYRIFCGQLINLGLDTERMLPEGNFLTPHQKLAEDITWLKLNWPHFEAILRLLYIDKRELKIQEETYIGAVIDDETRLGKRICRALESRDASAYRIALSMLKRYKSLSLDYARLQSLLDKLKENAAEWAESFWKLPKDFVPPDFVTIQQAWQYRYFEQLLQGKQEEVDRAEKKLREVAIEAKNIEQELNEKIIEQLFMQRLAEQDLVDEILGENMPSAFAVAPSAWIITPREAAEQHFDAAADIMVIGAAHTAGASVLSLTLLTNTLILLGDEHQIPDSREGIELPKLPFAPSIYHLFQPYSAHAQLRYQSLSVPNIVNFANHSIYADKLITLRPPGYLRPIIAYDIGSAEGLTRSVNRAEAETAVALLAACLAHKEYVGKTFGVVTRTESEQAKLIGELALRRIGAKLLSEHKFMWGTAEELQGSYCDVVFLSLTESSVPDDETKVEKKPTEGEVAESIMRLTTVSTSLAREQLWVIHSQPKENFDDIGVRQLLDYAAHSDEYQIYSDDYNDADIDELSGDDIADWLQEEGWAAWSTRLHRLPLNAVVVSAEEKMALIELVTKKNNNKNYFPDNFYEPTLHVLGSDFMRNSQRAVDNLSEKLTENGFKPANKPTVDAGKLLMQIMVEAQNYLQAWQEERKMVQTEMAATTVEAKE